MSDDETIDFSDPETRLKFFWEYATNNRGEFFDATVIPHLKFISASRDPHDPNSGNCTFELTVPRSLCNAGDNLHGGAVALIFDLCTSMAVAGVSREGFWDTGHVSRQLNCKYLRPAPIGSVLLVESHIEHLGKSMGMLKGVMRRKDNGKICYTCDHDKAQVVFKPAKL